MIRAIMVDMDGTFLDNQKKYDKNRFLKQFEELKKRQIKFVVASGNQYQHLTSFFPEITDEITYIAENGAKIIENNELIYKDSISRLQVSEVLKLIEKETEFSGYRLVMSGEKGAYIKKDVPKHYMEKAQFFYKNLIEVDDYMGINDIIYKFAFNFPPEHLKNCETKMNEIFKDNLKAVTSGHEAMDLVSRTAGKEKGVEVLSKYWQISPTDFAAFGDNLNDYDMLKRVGFSYAMENGRDELKQIATKVIGTNHNQAVLDEFDVILRNQQ